MSRAKFHSNKLMDLVDSGSEDSLMSAVPPSRVPGSISKMPRTGKPRGRPATNKVTKAAQTSTSRRLSDRIAAVVETSEGRRALGEKTNTQRPVVEGKDRNGGKQSAIMVYADKPKAARGRPKKTETIEDAEPEEIPDSMPKETVPRVAKRGARPAKPRSRDVEIPETQLPDNATDVDERDDEQMEDLTVPDISDPPPSLLRRVVVPPSAARRTTDAIPFQANDPALRRRLGEMTKKYESLELKYRDLRDVAVREAERNFDRLKKEGDERTDAANQLILSLKSELAMQTELAQDGEVFKEQLMASEAEVVALQDKVAYLNQVLLDTKAEIKTLCARLSASRSGDPVNVKVTDSAMKASGSSDASVSQLAQMKEDLYGDLTGLIVRGVKKGANEDVFDCIQTGRNGTLHFKLAIGNDNTGDNFDEAQFMYMPQLDPSRDGELMDLLPDYLVEEITFPRPHAAKFYSRVMRVLTERLE